MIIPVVVSCLAVVAHIAHSSRENKKPSPEIIAQRTKVFDVAINTCKDSEKLRSLAETFASVGQIAEATRLCQRADLIDAPPELKKARREALEKGLSSTNKEGVSNLATAFEEIGATAAAAKLREYADTL